MEKHLQEDVFHPRVVPFLQEHKLINGPLRLRNRDQVVFLQKKEEFSEVLLLVLLQANQETLVLGERIRKVGEMVKSLMSDEPEVSFLAVENED